MRDNLLMVFIKIEWICIRCLLYSQMKSQNKPLNAHKKIYQIGFTRYTASHITFGLMWLEVMFSVNWVQVFWEKDQTISKILKHTIQLIVWHIKHIISFLVYTKCYKILFYLVIYYYQERKSQYLIHRAEVMLFNNKYDQNNNNTKLNYINCT